MIQTIRRHKALLIAAAAIGVLYLLTLVDGPFPTNKTGTLSQWVGGLTAVSFTLWLDEKRTQCDEAKLAAAEAERATLPRIEVTRVRSVVDRNADG